MDNEQAKKLKKVRDLLDECLAYYDGTEDVDSYDGDDEGGATPKDNGDISKKTDDMGDDKDKRKALIIAIAKKK